MDTSYTLTLDRTKYIPAKATSLDAIVWKVKMKDYSYSEVFTYSFAYPQKPTLWTSGTSILWSTPENSVSNNIVPGYRVSDDQQRILRTAGLDGGKCYHGNRTGKRITVIFGFKRIQTF